MGLGFLTDKLKAQRAQLEGANYANSFAGLGGGADLDISSICVPLVYGKTKVKAQPILVPSDLSRQETYEITVWGQVIQTGLSYISQAGQWALCQGPILGTVSKVWLNDKYSSTLTKLHPFTVTSGPLSQSPWSYLTGLSWYISTTLTVSGTTVTISDPDYSPSNVIGCVVKSSNKYLTEISSGSPTVDEFLPTGGGITVNAAWDGYALGITYIVFTDHTYNDYGYGGTALLRCADLNLSKNYDGRTPEIWCEVQGLLGTSDQNPIDIIEDLLTDTVHGAGIDSGLCSFENGQAGDAASSLRRWSDQASLLISAAIEDQQSVASIIENILVGCDGELVWSDGLFRLYPYAEADLGTFSAWQTPQYEITVDDLISAPVLRVVDADNTYNVVPVAYTQRAPDGTDWSEDQVYKTKEVATTELATADSTGTRKAPTVATYLHSKTAAQKLSAILARRLTYQRTEYELHVTARYMMLEPFDIIELTFAPLGISERTLRIVSMELNEDDTVRLTCVDWLGMPDFDPEPLEPDEPLSQDVTQDPGDISVSYCRLDPRSMNVLLAAGLGPSQWWGGAECWISWNGTDYHQVGFTTGCNFGQLTGALTTGPVEDTQTPQVDLQMAQGVLPDTSTNERDAGLRAMIIGDECVWFGDVTEDSDHVYTLDDILRGQEGSVIEAHAAGEPVLYIDDKVLRLPVTPDKANATLYVKWLTENLFGSVKQELADVTPYTYTIPASVGQYRLFSSPVRDEFQGLDLKEWEPVSGETNTGIPTLDTDADATGGKILLISGQLTLALDKVIPFNPTSVYTLSVKYRLGSTNPTLKAGLYGLDGDRVTWLGKTGGTGLSDQPVGLDTTDVDSNFQLARFYWSGIDTSGGDGASDLTELSAINDDTRYLGIWIQAGAGAGAETEVDFIELREEVSGRTIVYQSLPFVALVPDGDGQMWPNGHSEREPGPDDPINMIDNEEQVLPSYTNYGSEYGWISDANPKFGTYSREIDGYAGSSGSVVSRYLAHRSACIAGRTYALTAQLTCDSALEQANSRIYFYNAAGSQISYVGSSVYISNGSWVKAGVCGVAPDGAVTMKAAIGVITNIVSYTAYIDDISLREVGGETGRQICSGRIDDDGTILGSQGAYFTVSHAGTGLYEVTIPGLAPGAAHYCTVCVTPSPGQGRSGTGGWSASDYADIRLLAFNYSAVDCPFNFIIIG